MKPIVRFALARQPVASEILGLEWNRVMSRDPGTISIEPADD
jgi:hypothetical protein